MRNPITQWLVCSSATARSSAISAAAHEHAATYPSLPALAGTSLVEIHRRGGDAGHGDARSTTAVGTLDLPPPGSGRQLIYEMIMPDQWPNVRMQVICT
jgi:hypothetical protein